MWDLYIYFPIHLHGVVLNQLSTGTLPFFFTLMFEDRFAPTSVNVNCGFMGTIALDTCVSEEYPASSLRVEGFETREWGAACSSEVASTPARPERR
jgi:hypothetical protein